ncbi:MAG TPA: hypothetical protein VN256_12895 [Pyrinomonadaceae bacterium]|nr:hypothetical protein [Pyrinomonadaceae bacterium]
MKSSEARSINKGEKVAHKRYGLCVVKDVLTCGSSLFGLVLTPQDTEGQSLLAADCGCDIPDYLEADPRTLSTPEQPST